MRNNGNQQQGKTNAPFLKMMERRLEEFPQFGAFILDSVIVACRHVMDALSKFEVQLKDKADELRKAQGGPSTGSDYQRGVQKGTEH